MTGPPAVSEIRPIICPSCESDELRSLSQAVARCASCGCVLNGTALRTLRQIVTLPDAVGGHACECGHPEMRLLPDGVFRCPSCRSEVVPVADGESQAKTEHHGKAYWFGWLDGRFGEAECFAHNERLKAWEDPSERLEYYRGHRAGRQDRRTKDEAAPEAA